MARPAHLRARYGSPEHRAKQAEAARRVHARKQRVAEARPAHVTAWLESGRVPRELRPIVDCRTLQKAEMLEDLGGEEHASAMERATLELWERAMVACDVEHFRYLAGERDAPDRMLQALNAARSALQAVGLERRRHERQVPTLAEYLRQREAETAQASPRAPNGNGADPEAAPSGDDAADGDGEPRAEEGEP